MTTGPGRSADMTITVRNLAVSTTFAVLVAGCGAGERNTAPAAEHPHSHAHGHRGSTPRDHHRFDSADAWARVFDDPSRDEWQRPDDVIRALALEPTMSVADVGAGTGYFAVRLARAVPEGQVIATDIEPDMVRFLTDRAQREHLTNLKAVQVNSDRTALAPQSVDRILIVHVWHHLTDRVAYARDFAAALRPGGKLVVVDFNVDARRGPPAAMRVAPEDVIRELEPAGFTASVSPLEIADQYVVVADLTRTDRE